MNIFRHRFLRSIFCLLLLVSPCKASVPRELKVVVGGLAALTTAMLYYCIPIALEDTESIIARMVDTLQENTEKRRSVVRGIIEKLEHELEYVKTTLSLNDKDSNMHEKNITMQLFHAYEEYKTLDFDYQRAYLGVRPEALFLKWFCVRNSLSGGIFLLGSAFLLSRDTD